MHVGLRLAVIEVAADDERTREAVPLTVLVNPVLRPIGGETVSDWEGCLSVPGLRGVVPRSRRLELRALDRKGKPWRVEAQDFFARVIQHVCDHLDGSVYLDRMTGMRTLCFVEEWERYWESSVGEPRRGERGSGGPPTK